MAQNTSTYYVWIGGSCIFFSDQYYLDASRRQTLHTPIIGIPPTVSSRLLVHSAKIATKNRTAKKRHLTTCKNLLIKPSFRVKKTNYVIYNT